MNFKALAAGLRELRRARGWSQVELARRSKLSHSTVYRTERGELAASLVSIVMLAKALGVRASEVVAKGEL